MKNFKDLFIKSDSEENESNNSNSHSFPVSSPESSHSNNAPSNPYLAEIIDVYEKGLESINMPGYDFFEFYRAVSAAGTPNESMYRMAFQMGKTMDSTVTAEKLASDADFYLSKIDEVHQKFTDQGRSKISSITKQQEAERSGLDQRAKQLENEIHSLKAQIQNLERELGDTKTNLSKVSGKYRPEEQEIQDKLAANDQAMNVSVKRLKSVKEAIIKYLK